MPAWNYIGGNIGFDGTAANFTPSSLPTGSPQQGDLILFAINLRNGEGAPTLSGDWTLINNSPTASNNLTGTNAISQLWVYYCIRGASDPSYAITRGSGTPDLCNYGFHVFRPASGYQFTSASLVTSSGNTLSTGSTSHTHPSVTTDGADQLVGHYAGQGSSGGFSAFDAATDPTTDSGAGSTSYTGTMTQDAWERRGNQGTTTLLDGSLHLGIAIKSAAGSTGQLSATNTISRRTCSVAFVFKQIALELAPTGITSSSVVGNPTVTQNHSLSPTGVTSASVVGNPAATIDRSFSPTGVSSASVVGQPALNQNHSLSPNGVSSASVVGQPALTQNHVLSPTGVTSSGVVGQPTVTQQSSNVSVSPTGVTSSGVVGNPALTQNHATSPTGVISGGVVGNPALSQNHALTPAGITSASVVGNPALTQNHVLSPTGVSSGATVGTPAITSQNHSLTPVGVSTAGPTVGIVDLNPAVGGTGGITKTRGMIVNPGSLLTR